MLNRTVSNAEGRAVAGVRLPRHVRLIGVPLDLGAARRGVDMGPSALRIAQLSKTLERLGHTVSDDGNLAVPQRETLGGSGGDLAKITEVCRVLAEHTAHAIRRGEFPLVLGGDHSLAAGSVAGAATALAERGARLGVIWLDAHGDLNTPATSASGNVHGMPAAHLLGDGDAAMSSIAVPAPALRAEHLVYVGLRDLDPPERASIHRHAITAFTMRDIDERGMRHVLEEAIAKVSDGTAGIYVSLDLDFVDPREAPGVGTPVRGGATFREAHLIMELLHESGLVRSLDLVELNPFLDERGRTALLMADLAASLFGRRILDRPTRSF